MYRTQILAMLAMLATLLLFGGKMTTKIAKLAKIANFCVQRIWQSSSVPRGTRLVTIVGVVLLLSGSLIGCMEGFHHRPILGTRVHSFNVAGRQFVHCSILMDRSKTQENHDAIQVCRDEVAAPAPPEPEKGK